MRNWQWIIGSIFLLLIGIYIGYTLWRIGACYKPLSHNTLTDTCNSIPFLPGPEDMEIDPATGYVYGISYDRWAADTLSTVKGSLYRFLPDSAYDPVMLTGNLPPHFFPHGMSLFRRDSVLYMFVINHGKGNEEQIERFRLYNDNTFIHDKTFTDPLIVSANDVVAIDTNRFYVANDSRSRSRFSRGIDVFFQRATGYILYYDGVKGYQVSKKMAFPNGIVIDPTHSYLYTSETIGGNMRIWKIEDGGYRLNEKGKMYISQGLDNLSCDTQGNLWVTCQPNLMAVNRFMKNPSHHVPFEVYRITLSDDKLNAELVISHTGHQLSGASIVLPVADHLIIGSVCQARLWMCKSPHF